METRWELWNVFECFGTLFDFVLGFGAKVNASIQGRPLYPLLFTARTPFSQRIFWSTDSKRSLKMKKNGAIKVVVLQK